MATPKEIAAALTGPGHTVTAKDVEAWIADGWRYTPQSMIDANALGLPVTLDATDEDGDELEDGTHAWAWVEGHDGTQYRVPVQVMQRMTKMQREINDLRRSAATQLREHRAELAEALGTPEPDPTPLHPGDDVPVIG